jgi:hypothetical protein
MVIQGTKKVIVMDRHNFKDEELVKKQKATQKTNETGGKLKEKN